MTFPALFLRRAAGHSCRFLLAKYTGLVREIPVPVEGFYSKGFVDKLERERRYGNVYTVEDRGALISSRWSFHAGFGYWTSSAGPIIETKCLTTIMTWH